MPEIYPVGMAELRIAREPDVLAAYGIGSCVIVAMYDPKSRIGGMSHIMLPESTAVRQENVNPRKFADTAVPLLFQALSHAGVYKSSIWAKVIGGAEMFPATEDFKGTIGEKNTKASLIALQSLGIPVIGKEVGGLSGRSMEMDLSTGRIALSVLGKSDKEI